MFAVLRHRGGLILFSAGAISRLGDSFFLVTMPVWLLELTGTPTAGGIALTLELVPVLALGILAGVWVDRWNRFRTMVVSDLVRGAAMLGVTTACLLTPGSAVVAVCVGMMVLASAGLFFGPSRNVMSKRLLPQELVAPFQSLAQTSDSAISIFGPLLALGLYGLAGPVPAFLIDALSFFASAALLYLLPPEARTWGADAASGRGAAAVLADMREGFRYVAANRTVKWILTVLLVMVAGAGTTGVIQAYFVQQQLQLAPRFVGFIATGQGVGMVSGALLAGAIHKRVGSGMRLGLGLLTLGVMSLFFGLSRTLVMASLTAVLAGVGVAFTLNGFSTLMITSVETAYLGRVSGLLGTANVAVSLVSMLCGTALVTVVPMPVMYGVIGAFVALAGVAALYLLARPKGEVSSERAEQLGAD